MSLNDLADIQAQRRSTALAVGKADMPMGRLKARPTDVSVEDFWGVTEP
jgi:hypothetical protein